MANLIGLPPDAEVWSVGGDWMVVWYVPNTNPRVPIAWRIPTAEDRTALGVSKPDRTLSWGDFYRAGTLLQGTTDEIPDTGANPFDTLVSEYETEVKVKPWLADPEILALWTSAYVEGRPITPAELQGTDWWRSHNESERSWISLNASDPATAAARVGDNRLQVASLLKQAGVDNASEDLINRIADQWTTGVWSQAYAVTQVQALADPFSGLFLDGTLASFRDDLDTTTGRVEEVRSLVRRWLGPAYSSGWTDDVINRWAGELRNNTDAQTELTQILRGQRMSLFPEYENADLTYEDIAAPWRGIFRQMWGEIPDETSPLFTQVVKMNDLTAATELLRTEGLKNGNATVSNSFLSDISSIFGSQIRPVGSFR